LLAAREQAEIAATRARAHAEKARTEILAAYERDAVAIEKLFPTTQANKTSTSTNATWTTT
jgi:hypothetical protein